ncbi:Flp family type IVb pilin [Novosphingobium mangrovi (ex Huang et al. 2023)]|uniref:Flp family type IVb pilin n=1 Tax=Novosphingobium mangrovi (ex Huang et al. 2023) TaxID=2976432 RepID=A0ABT2I842_9SPHN|nr:Flp family type IVb pilin [Novosphingobium mangrovi (ex Huang et al. 2023)]MCT2400995.1 Flp family type IVb pilin [Novosphingobium mangrovi (ex Huang et al. 2023)]
MARFRNLSNILRDTRGASAVEYGLILAMIVLAMFAMLQGVASEAIGMWNDVATKTSDATGATP